MSDNLAVAILHYEWTPKDGLPKVAYCGPYMIVHYGHSHVRPFAQPAEYGGYLAVRVPKSDADELR